ncbi:MAG: PD40 domain-containing protein [Bacteroidetes bacterium]|nr:PD40 domain-containing protein [Bacteroidota bacterium]
MNKILKILFVFVICHLPSYICHAQQNYSSKNKKAIKHYEEAVQFANSRDGENAKKSLLVAIEKDNMFIEAHMMLSYIYGDLKQPEKAVEEMKKAIEISPGFSSMNYYSLAKFQIATGNYKDAKQNLLRFLKNPSENKEINAKAEQWSANCDFAIPAIENPVPFKPVNAGTGLNSQYDEYFPCMTADEQTFLFTRNLPSKSSPYGWQEDFYVSDKIDGKWGTAYSIGPKINTERNEGAPSLSADGNMLFFVVSEEMYDNANGHDYGLGRKGYGSCDIFCSVKEGNDWSKPRNAGSGVNTYHWETQPSFSSDGKTLYFIRGKREASSMEIRNPDIYMAVMGENGQFGKAIPLSGVINTKGNEQSVFIHPDNQTLYFSSDGHPGMGGLDIFMSRRQPNGEWGESVNLGYPINTFSDENSLLVSRDGKIAYFASDRTGGYGGLDIYTFDLYEAAQPGKTIFVKGKVFDAVTKLPLDADIDVVDLQTGNSVVKWLSNKTNGEFFICLPVNKNYAFNTSKTAYLFYSENFVLNESKDYQPFVLNIPLSPITKDSIVVLRNVFFETNKFNLKDESKSELNKLVDFLNKNSILEIELGGHTDNVGERKLNQVLSENRAKSVLEYLVANGIAKERLTFKGYGDTKPVVANDSDEHRQMNRRTEFKVISK